MVTLDKIRLTGLLRKKPWQRGFFYEGFSLRLQRLSASRPPRRNVKTGSIAAARAAALFGFAFEPSSRSLNALKAAVRDAATICGRGSFAGASRSLAISGAIISS